MKLTSYYNTATREVQVRLTSDPVAPGAFVKLGNIVHEPEDNASGMQKMSISHVIYQHVQEQLYTKYKLENMQIIKITYGGTFKPPVSITVDVGQTSVVGTDKLIMMNVVVYPTDATTGPLSIKPINDDLVLLAYKQGTREFSVQFEQPGKTIIRVALPEIGFYQEVPVECRERWYADSVR